MVYAVIGLVVVLVGVGIAAVVWVSKLKDRITDLCDELAVKKEAMRIATTNLVAETQRRVALEEQINACSKAYDELERLAASGALDTSAGIVAELGKLFKSNG